MKTHRERFEVTEHHLPVAIDWLMAAGRVIPARLDLSALDPLTDRPSIETTISKALAEQRREE